MIEDQRTFIFSNINWNPNADRIGECNYFIEQFDYLLHKFKDNPNIRLTLFDTRSMIQNPVKTRYY